MPEQRASLRGKTDADGFEAHCRRVMQNDLRVALVVGRWERFVEWATAAIEDNVRLPIRVERWECRDAGGRWRRYWRHAGSLPRWSAR